MIPSMTITIVQIIGMGGSATEITPLAKCHSAFILQSQPVNCL
jgi:hypothetical protein